MCFPNPVHTFPAVQATEHTNKPLEPIDVIFGADAKADVKFKISDIDIHMDIKQFNNTFYIQKCKWCTETVHLTGNL